MKKIFKALKLTGIPMLFVIVFISCDKDYNTIGSDIIGNKNFITANATFSATSYNKKLNPVRTNGLPSNLLGVNNDPVYGSTIANIVTQVLPTSYPDSFGENAIVDSVILSIPYYNKVAADSPDENGNTVYSISDSLYGDKPIKLSVNQSNYFLRTFDPDSEFDAPQYYYSNANTTINFDNHIEALIYENESFFPSSSDIVLTKFNEDTQEYEETERLSPRLRDTLSTAFWTTLILDKAGQPEISNSNNFLNYFRGVYFKAETITPDGNMILLNLGASGANITMYYSFDSEVLEDERDIGEYQMLFSGVRLNTFDNNYDITLTDGDEVLGDKELYLKGGEGSMAIIDLFGNIDNDGIDDGDGISDELEDFQNKKDKWLINEANLIFYEDEAMYSPNEDFHKYDRVYIYDLKNNIPLVDYFFDPTANDANPFNSNIFHLGQRFVDENGAARFKIRITEHIKRILNQDSTNTKLGLVISTNVNSIQNLKVFDSDDEPVTLVPSGAVLSPKGTILLGSNPNVPEDKRVQLEIFYTEPEN